MPSSTVENYAKQIYLHSQSVGDVVPMGRVAEALEVSPGTATTMAKSLEKAGLADYAPREGVKLTEEGRSLALQILRRHRLVEYFLVETLDMDWSEVHEEAEALEHSLSERVLDRIDAFLGFPRFDPHGDPIPRADGTIEERRLCPLSECEVGTKAVVSRILAQDTDFLQFAASIGMMPGVELDLDSVIPGADCITVKIDGGLRTLSNSAASKVLVEA